MQVHMIAGLGNPGSKYVGTRHNIGFHIVDAYAEQLSLAWKKSLRFKAKYAVHSNSERKLILVKPQAFMNCSGGPTARLLSYFEVSPESLTVIYDEINLPLGRVKLSIGGSSGGHNGIESVMAHVKNRFIRFRVGIGPKTHKEMAMTDFVLGKFCQHEVDIVYKKVNEFLAGLQLIIDSGAILAMNRINQRKKVDESDGSNQTV